MRLVLVDIPVAERTPWTLVMWEVPPDRLLPVLLHLEPLDRLLKLWVIPTCLTTLVLRLFLC